MSEHIEDINAVVVERERLRLKLIETQMALLQYQHQETAARVAGLEAASAAPASGSAEDG